MKAYRDNGRQGKLFIVAGVVALVSGFVLQTYAVNSVADEAPVQVFSNSGSTAGLAEAAWLLIVGGVILTVIGVIRYAQSGGDGHALAFTPVRVAPAVAATPVRHAASATSAAPAALPAFCASCGAGIVGEGRFCAACGTSTAY